MSKTANPLEGWQSAGSHVGEILGRNDEAFFLKNGTVFFTNVSTATMYSNLLLSKKTIFCCCSRPRGLIWVAVIWQDKGDNYPNCSKQCIKCRNMKAISRAESLADAIAGNFTYINRGATQVLLGGSNASSSEFCVNWEGNNIWLDGEGYFHSIAHAWDGKPSDYPQVDGKGCCTQPAIGYANESMAAAECNRIAGYRCTAYGGHTYSMDGLVWYVSPAPAYTNAIRYTEGSVVEYKARERPHLIFDDNNEPLLLGNAVCLSRRNWMDTGFLIGHDHSFVQLVPLNSKSDDVAAKLIAAAVGLAGSSPLSAAASTDGMYWLESPLSKVLVNDTAPANWSRHWPLPVAGGDSPSGAPQLGKGNGQDSGSEPRGPVLGIDLAAQTGEAEAWQVALHRRPSCLASVSLGCQPAPASSGSKSGSCGASNRRSTA